MTGYWSLFYETSDGDLLRPFTDRVELTEYFAEGSLIVVSALFLSFALFQVLHFCALSEREADSRDSRANTTFSKAKEVQRVVYNALLFPVGADFFLVLNISGFISSMRLGSPGSSLIDTWSSVSLLFAFFCLGMVFKIELLPSPSGEESQENQTPLGGFSDAKRWYVPLVLVKLAALALLIEIGVSYSSSLVGYAIASLSLLSLLVLVWGRPYLGCFDNLRVILCETAVLCASGLPLVHRFVEIDEAYELLVLYVLQGIIFLFLVFALIRVFLLYCSAARKWKEGASLSDLFQSSAQRQQRNQRKMEGLERKEA